MMAASPLPVFHTMLHITIQSRTLSLSLFNDPFILPKLYLANCVLQVLSDGGPKKFGGNATVCGWMIYEMEKKTIKIDLREKFVKYCETNAVADPRWAPGTRTPPLGLNCFIFMQFLATILKNNRLAHPLRELVLPSEKSWIRHWNMRHPGSATVIMSFKFEFDVTIIDIIIFIYSIVFLIYFIQFLGGKWPHNKFALQNVFFSTISWLYILGWRPPGKS